VGRVEEKALFSSVIAQTPMPVVVWLVYGPGGVGKTTLLRQVEGICRQEGVKYTTLDGRYLQANPEFFIGSLCMATGAPDPVSAMATLSADGKGVLFIDTYEAIEPLDGWLRDTFIPDLPENVLVVLLGRKRPAAGWRSDVWQTLCRVSPLRNLSDADSRKFLDSHTVPQNVHEQILGMTHGYPLALTLVAENFAQTGTLGLGPDPSLDIVSVLLDRFVEGVDEPLYRDVLELCSLIRMTTEALIAEVLNADRAAELFAWLKSLSFIEMTPFGLMPHDLARDAIARELRWRNADRYSELHHRARAYYSDRLDRASGAAQQLILFDYIYLHRDNPVMAPFFQWHLQAAAFADSARPDDLPEILRMVDRFEGPESAEWAKFWFEVQPAAFHVMRDSVTPTRLCGLLTTLNLASAPDAAWQDPATRVAMRRLEATAPLRAGERATYFRFWMADEEYQSVSPVQSMIFVTIVQHYVTEPALAATFLPCSEPEFWAPMFQYALHNLVDGLAFEVGSRTYGVYSIDWRALPVKPWLALLSEREVPIKAPAEKPRQAGDIVVLSREGFEESISEALKSYTNVARLAKNPLIRSRLVIDRVSADADTKERVAKFRELIKEAAETLNSNNKDDKLYLALETCYLRPLRSQEAAADKIDVSIATIRRHLKAGASRVADVLWQQETGL
jgi:energy-coupling factor transporter ATP-binding protein EcfA2